MFDLFNAFPLEPQHGSLQGPNVLEEAKDHISHIADGAECVLNHCSLDVLVTSLVELGEEVDGHCATKGSAAQENALLIDSWFVLAEFDHRFGILDDALLLWGAFTARVTSIGEAHDIAVHPIVHEFEPVHA